MVGMLHAFILLQPYIQQGIRVANKINHLHSVMVANRSIYGTVTANSALPWISQQGAVNIFEVETQAILANDKAVGIFNRTQEALDAFSRLQHEAFTKELKNELESKGLARASAQFTGINEEFRSRNVNDSQALTAPIKMAKSATVAIDGKKHTRCTFNAGIGRFVGPQKNAKLYESSFIQNAPVQQQLATMEGCVSLLIQSKFLQFSPPCKECNSPL